MNIVVNPFHLLVMLVYSFIMFTLFFCDSFMNLWLLIELAMFMFIAIGFLELNNEVQSTESLLSYYLVQSGLSIFVLVSYFTTNFLLLSLVILSNLGVFPLNFWFYSVMINGSFNNLFYMITLQKFPPFMLFTLFSYSDSLIFVLIVVNLLVCGFMAILSSDFNTLLIGSSLANNSWLLIALDSSLSLFLLFFWIYSLTLFILFSSSVNLVRIVGLLSLSGLPPFPLFFIKFYTIYSFLIGTELFAFVVGCIFILFALVLSAAYVRYIISSFITLGGKVFYVA